MSFDGIVMRAVILELQQEIETGRITKIYQPSKHDLVFHIRAHGKKQQLILSVNPTYARIHLTTETYDNPHEPPMFCMLLRKHLEGAIIERVDQKGLDRIAFLHIRSKNEIGDTTYKKLIIEIMGRHSNIILVDEEKNLILDSIKHIGPAVNRHRIIMPGQPYVEPPEQQKSNPLLADNETILKKIDFNSGKLDQQLMTAFAGISPLLAKEIIFRAGPANQKAIPGTFLSIIQEIKNHQYVPSIMTALQKEYFYVLPLAHLNGEAKAYPSASAMLDRFYFGKADRDRVKQQAHDLERFIRNEITKNEKKIVKLQQTLKDAEKADKYKLYGELLTAHLYAIKRGDKVAVVENYYDEQGGTVSIPLSPQKSPSENAQTYFQKYQKAKNSVGQVKEQIRLAREETVYFETVLQQLETASPKDIEEIRDELAEEGYLKKRPVKERQKSKAARPVLDRFLSSDGIEILIGKNNKQNDYLTSKLANKEELWFHTKDIPGSHVVIRAINPPDRTILEAANLAAYFSKARSSGSVPVDYTKIRFVKKPSGAKPGFVIYENQKTVYVTPDEELVLKLKSKS